MLKSKWQVIVVSERAYLSIGTNIGDRQAHLAQALSGLDQDGVHLDAVSPVYETEPVGGVEQANFYNIAVALTTSLSAQALLDLCHQIEQSQHRTRQVHWGPRTIDLDILYFGHQSISTKTLTVPHPEIPNRRFVLIPLLDVTGDDPELQQKTKEQLKKTTDHNWVRPIDKGGVLTWIKKQ